MNHIMDAANRHCAFESQAFVLSVTGVMTDEIIQELGQGGSVERLKSSGGYSATVEPRGRYLVEPKEEGEGILYADLDFDSITDAKTIVDSAGHYARPDVVQMIVNRDP